MTPFKLSSARENLGEVNAFLAFGSQSRISPGGETHSIRTLNTHHLILFLWESALVVGGGLTKAFGWDNQTQKGNEGHNANDFKDSPYLQLAQTRKDVSSCVPET